MRAVLILVFFISHYVSAQQPKLMLPVGHLRDIYCLAVSPDEKFIVTGSQDATIKLWERSSGKLLASIEDLTGAIDLLQFSSDGMKLLASLSDKSVHVFETKYFTRLFKIDGFTQQLRSVQFNPDNKTLLTAGWHTAIRIWDASTGRPIKQIGADSSSYESAAYSTDGKLILIRAPNAYTIEVREAASGVLLHEVKALDFRLSNNGKMIAAPSMFGAIRIMDLKTGTLIRSFKFDGNLYGMAFSPDDAQLVLTKTILRLKP